VVDRVVWCCTDDLEEAVKVAAKLKAQGKRAGFAEVQKMLDPPKTVYKYCVFYLKGYL
jgi:hypothetical protein